MTKPAVYPEGAAPCSGPLLHNFSSAVVLGQRGRCRWCGKTPKEALEAQHG